MASAFQAAMAAGRPLTGHVALVTGAGSGMGRAIAIALAAAGSRVALLGRTRSTLEETAAQIAERVGSGRDDVVARTHAVDIGDEAAARGAVEAVAARWGRLDLVVNNAGTNVRPRSVAETSLDDWRRVLDTNLSGVYYVTRAAIPTMRAQGGGHFVTISSVAGKLASEISGAAYCASKFGVTALTHQVNLEEWRHGIKASCVFPGEVNTPILDRRPEPPPPEKRRRILQPDDIADLVLYLATLPAHVAVDEVVIVPRTQRPWG